MTADEVLRLLELFSSHHIEVWVDGGWAVDALLGKVTRMHADLDIAVAHKDVPVLRRLLGEGGYMEIPRSDTTDTNFVLEDSGGRKIDVHSFTLDSARNNVYGVPYPAASLTGEGVIKGHRVPCIAPEWLVQFHTGYVPDENDYRDVKALCERFGIALPSEYKRFHQAD